MEINAVAKEKIKSVLFISGSGAVIGFLFAAAFYEFTYHRGAEGALIGLLITCGISCAELFYFSFKARYSTFRILLITRSVFYLFWISFCILSVLFFMDSLQQQQNILKVIRSSYIKRFLLNDFIPIFFFSVAVSILINFFTQITRILGGRVIANLLLGRYEQPASQIRIFMFLDIKSSTEIAEKLGASSYSELLQDFFLDVAEPVAATGGEIYQYVGDEVVITWPFTENDNRCIDCFFMIDDKIQNRKAYYADKYGVIPGFKAGIHAGTAVITRVGELQQEIVYHGDVLNTASRIQKECNTLNEPLLVSNAFLSLIKLNEKYCSESIGYYFLKGKNKGIQLNRIIKTIPEAVRA